MKNILSIFAAIFAMALFSSCGVNMATITNHNANETQVQLSNNNLMDKANLKDHPRAVINMVSEESIHGVPPIYYTRTVTVSANVIEFIK